MRSYHRTLYILVFIIPLMVACGGGGGGGGGAPDTTAPTTTASPPGGNYDTSQLVTLTSNETATIYYTIDGSVPSIGGATTLSAASPASVPVGPGLTVLQFFGVDTAGNQEAVKTETYTIFSASGTWVGSYSTELFPETPLLLELVQTGASVAGTYTDKVGNFGTFSATVSGTNFDMTITSSNPGCPGSFTGTGTIVGATLIFNFSGTDCLGIHNNGVGSVTYQVGTVLEYGIQNLSNLLLSGTDLLWANRSEKPIKKMPVTGGMPSALTQYLGVPISMTILGSDMYWVDERPGGDQALHKSTLDGATTETLAIGDRLGAYNNDDIVVDGINAYWVTSTVSPNEYSIQKIPLDGSPPTMITTAPTSQSIGSMVRDATYLYWVEGTFPDLGIIKRTPLAGGPITEVYTVQNNVSGNLIVEGADLIFAEYVYPYPFNYRILKVPTSGGTPTVLAALAQDPVPLKITTDAINIYWFDGDGVFSMPISGGSITQLASISSTGYDIDVDATSVIWLENDGLSGALYEVPKTGGTPTVLATELFGRYGGKLAIGANKIYFTEGGNNIEWYGRIAEMPRTGGAITSFITGVTFGAPMVTVGVNVYVVDGWRILTIPIGGGHAETLARAGFYINDLATDGVYVYWLESGPIQPIKRVPVGGGLIETLATSSNFAEFITTDGTYVFWHEGVNTIKKVPVSGGSVTTVATGVWVSDFISDGTHLYFSAKAGGDILRVSIDGGPITVLSQPNPEIAPWIAWTSLALDSINLYSISNIELKKVPKTGGLSTILISGGFIADEFNSSNIVVDSSSVYWTERIGGTVKSNPK